MQTIYLVTINGKISSEGYRRIEEAQAFIKNRIATDLNALDLVNQQTGYYIIRSNNKEYRIEDVRVK